jgi:hypothetical protein
VTTRRSHRKRAIRVSAEQLKQWKRAQLKLVGKVS